MAALDLIAIDKLTTMSAGELDPSNDWAVIQDVSAPETKKIRPRDLVKDAGALLADGSVDLTDALVLQTTTDPGVAAGKGYVYTKDVGGGTVELFYRDPALNITQLTKAGVEALLVDGSRAMTGTFDYGGNPFTNLGGISDLNDEGQIHFYNIEGTNYERAVVRWVSDLLFEIATEFGGTGSQRDIRIDGSVVRLMVASNARLIVGSTIDAWVDVDLRGNALHLGTGGNERIVRNNDSIEAYTGGTLALTARQLLDASGDVGLLASATADHTGIATAYYDGQRTDVDASGTVGDGTDDPDGIGNTLHRWRSDLGDGNGMVTRAAIEPDGTIHFAGVPSGSQLIGSSAGNLLIQSKSGFITLNDNLIVNGNIRLSSSNEQIQRVADSVSVLSGGVTAVDFVADPGTPADGDTNIAVRTHQDVGGTITPNLDSVTLGGDGNVPAGFRPLVVPVR